MKLFISLISSILVIFLFQNCGVFKTGEASFSSISPSDSIQGTDLFGTSIVPDSLNDVNDLELNNDAKDKFDEAPGDVVVDTDDKDVQRCSQSDISRWINLGNPSVEEAQNCVNGKKKIYIKHKRKKMVCLNGQLQELDTVKEYTEVKTISCVSQSRMCAGGVSSGEVTQYPLGELNKKTACPMGYQGHILNMHERVINVVCNDGKMKPLNIQAGKVLRSKNNCEAIRHVAAVNMPMEDTSPQTHFINVLNPDKLQCEGEVLRRYGVVVVCTMGGGCGRTCGMPGVNCASANPNIYGACLHDSMKPYEEHVVQAPGGGVEISCTADPAICQVYDEVLSRTPDQAGAHYWTAEYNRLKRELGEAEAYLRIKNHIMNSTEANKREMSQDEVKSYEIYAQHTSTNDSRCLTGTSCANQGEVTEQMSDSVPGGIVEGLYNTVLGRSSDSGGKAYWEAEAKKLHSQGLSYSQVQQRIKEHFMASEEFKNKN